MPAWLEQAFGAFLILLVLADVFLTVLYARVGTGLVSYRLARLTWRLFRGVAGLVRARRGEILSFCGPAILVLLILTWAATLTLGAALVMHPLLGTSIRSSGGGTPTDFAAALYAGGGSMAIVGASNLTPHTNAARLLFLFDSLVGASVISVTLNYLVQVYAALQDRNTLALAVHVLTAETGDAAELIAGLGPRGEFSAGYSNLTEFASNVTSVKEAHHFYPVLFYFRFQQAFYSVSRIGMVALDTATLITTALDDQRQGWLKASASVTQLRRASTMLLTTLEDAFLPGGAPDAGAAPDDRTAARWRARYAAGLRRLRCAGIQTVADEQAGAEAYIVSRARWDRYVTTLAPAMAHTMNEIDPAGQGPEFLDARQES